LEKKRKGKEKFDAAIPFPPSEEREPLGQKPEKRKKKELAIYRW